MVGLRPAWTMTSAWHGALQENLLDSICSAGAPDGIIRLQCHPRSLEDWLGVSLNCLYRLLTSFMV